MRIGRHNIDWILRDWGYAVSSRLASNGYPSHCDFVRVDNNSSDSVPLMSDNWPYPYLAKIHSAIKSLEDKYSDLLYYKRVLGMTYREIGDHYKTGKSTIIDRMYKAETELINRL